MKKTLVAFINDSIVINNSDAFDYVPVKLAAILRECGIGLDISLSGKISEENEKEILEDIKDYLINTYSVGKIWTTVYKNPNQIFELEDAQRIEDQLNIYMDPTNLEKINPEKDEKSIWNSDSYQVKKLIKAVSEEDFKNISKRILGTRVVLGEKERATLDWFIANPEYLVTPEEIPMKEYLCMVAEVKDVMFKTSTDILRFALYLCKGHTKLSSGFSFREVTKKFNKSKRKLLLKRLENSLNGKNQVSYLQDTKKYRNYWYRLMNILHVDGTKYPKTREFFKDFKEKGSWWITWGTKIRKAQDAHDYKAMVELYHKRPGEFMRHLDYMLRKAYSIGDTDLFQNILDKMMEIDTTPKLLMEISYYYDLRDRSLKRSYTDKYGKNHFYPALEAEDPEMILAVKSFLVEKLKSIYKNRESLTGKKVILDFNHESEMTLSYRTNNSIYQSDTLLKGKEIDIPETGVLKFFIQWEQKDRSEDLDMHGFSMSSNGTMYRIGFNGTHRVGGRIGFSGDVLNTPGNCSEFICVDLDKFDTDGVNYLLIGVNNFKNRPLSSLDCWVGYSVVDQYDTRKGWAPSSADTKFRAKLNLSTVSALAAIVDFKRRKMRLLLEGVNESLFRSSNEVIREMAIPRLVSHHPNIYELMVLNTKARGGEIMSKEAYDELQKTEDFNQEDYILYGEDFVSDYEKVNEILL